MAKKISHKNYSEFSLEDFLQDDFFISSMKEPTEETLVYWEHFQKENKNLKNFYAAKDWIESINLYHTVLSTYEIEEMKIAIGKKQNSKKRNLRLAYWCISTAAAIALLMMVFRFTDLKKEENPDLHSDIIAFADNTEPGNKAEDIQLVLSDEQTIHLGREESEITYDTEGIVVDKKAITQDKNSGFNQLIVPAGKRSILNLSDGTKVWVNSDTRLIYPVSFDKNERVIYVNGEIYLDVSKDVKRPFIVKTKDVDVKVLGTQFNVTAYDADDTKAIVLVSGSVEVNPKNDQKTTRLVPDQMYMTGKGQNHIVTVDTKKYTSWIDGIYYCEDVSLDIILQRLSRYYGIEITCDPSISHVLFSGKLDLKENLTDIFDGISFTLPISYTNENGRYSINPI